MEQHPSIDQIEYVRRSLLPDTDRKKVKYRIASDGTISVDTYADLKGKRVSHSEYTFPADTVHDFYRQICHLCQSIDSSEPDDCDYTGTVTIRYSNGHTEKLDGMCRFAGQSIDSVVCRFLESQNL